MEPNESLHLSVDCVLFGYDDDGLKVLLINQKEATYAHADSDMAYQRQHSTSTMAAQTAAEASVGQLVLTHLSPRYAPGNRITPNDLLEEAKTIFPKTILAKDFLTLDIT